MTRGMSDHDYLQGVTLCRVFMTHQTAAAHARVFQEIEDIIQADTGRTLQWRHLHADLINETDNMILHWAADQHGGQAKGSTSSQ